MTEQLKNGVALITGTTSGVGLNTLKPLIRNGWEIIALNRSNRRAFEECEKIFSSIEMDKINFIEIDLSDLDQVRKGSEEIVERFGDRLGVVICNAAVYKPRLKKPDRSAQGFENSMAVNHLGHFLLINLLIDCLISSEKEINLNGNNIKFIPRVTVLGTVTANYKEFGGKIPIPAPAVGGIP